MSRRKNVCLVAADTDLLIMLIYIWNDLIQSIKMKSQGTRKYQESVSWYWAGCKYFSWYLEILDFYTRIWIVLYYICHIRVRKSFNIKISFQQKQKKKFDSSRSSRRFLWFKCDTWANKSWCIEVFVLLNGGKDTDNLSSLHYTKYMKIAFTTSSVKPEKLS